MYVIAFSLNYDGTNVISEASSKEESSLTRKSPQAAEVI
jgi:hypothetical protein